MALSSGVRDAWVHPEHQAMVQAWMSRSSTGGQRLILFAVVVPFGLVALLAVVAAMNRALLVPTGGIALLAMAGFMYRHPFATPQTVRLIGLRRSIVSARIGAAIVAIVGAGLLAASLV